ncbi:MAG: pyridoxamine 5'-phosphate oxidase family protein, partial [Alphaproteobacteria bacterium]|nr:pyridoxamine 5'-phosphate oxidase family protein [Alphaproteobacteria bacterium]
AKAWWDSAEDPNIRVLKVTPEEAEVWDGPGRLVATAKMLAAAATNTRPDVAKPRTVPM